MVMQPGGSTVSSVPSMSKLMRLGTGGSARVLAEHDPAAAGRRGERGQRGLGAHLHLTLAGGAAKLFDAVGVHRGARAPVAQVAAAGAERMRPLDPDIAGVKRERLAALHAV